MLTGGYFAAGPEPPPTFLAIATDYHSDMTTGQDTQAESDQNRGRGVVVDLERLEEHAREIYLTRFVEAIKAARGTYGRYLVLRSGDELAIKAADDGSVELLEEVRGELPGEPEPS